MSPSPAAGRAHTDAGADPPRRRPDGRPPSALVCVNVGTPRTVGTGKREVTTAIWKAPVEGRVAVRGVNLAGDDQADRTVHGGPDKAVYAYASEDIAWWAQELGRELGPGAFGENLTTAGLDLTQARVGDRWAVGTTLLEVRMPRVPCLKLALRFDDPRMLKRFTQATRPGAYLGILEEGELAAGDTIEVVHRAPHDVSMELFFNALLVDHDLLDSLLVAEQVPEPIRVWIESRG